MNDAYDNGRLRMDEVDAGELYLALEARHYQLLTRRREPDADRTILNSRVASVRRLMGKMESLFEEKNWEFPEEDTDGELQLPDAPGTGAPAPARR